MFMSYFFYVTFFRKFVFYPTYFLHIFFCGLSFFLLFFRLSKLFFESALGAYKCFQVEKSYFLILLVEVQINFFNIFINIFFIF
jgi:hypothetical protein